MFVSSSSPRAKETTCTVTPEYNGLNGSGSLLPAFEPMCAKDEPLKIHEDPPSSPIAPLSRVHPSMNVFYPTPAPSSSLGNTFSSPGPYYPPNSAHDKPAPGAFEVRRFDIRSPLSTVTLVRVPKSGRSITIGRSSKRCDVTVDKSNRKVSRAHLRVRYDQQADLVVIDCLGDNGIIVHVPEYKEPLIPSGEQAVISQTEYPVIKKQTILIEYVPGISVDVVGERALLELAETPLSEDTEDEQPRRVDAFNELKQESAEVSNEPPLSKETARIVEEPVSAVEESRPALDEVTNNTMTGVAMERSDTVSPSLKEKNISHQRTQSLPVAESPGSPKLKVANPVEKESTTADKQPAGGSIEQSAKPTPVKKRKLDMVSEDRKENIQHPVKQKSRLSAPHPEQPLRSETPEQDAAMTHEDISQIKHLATNQLAFSRLSSTPLSIIQKTNPILGNVSKHQLREALEQVACLGVIHRQGTDASGIPLEEEYYYIPEQDDDVHRRAMVEQSRGHGGLRACRKTHKQYYWKKPAAR